MAAKTVWKNIARARKDRAIDVWLQDPTKPAIGSRYCDVRWLSPGRGHRQAWCYLFGCYGWIALNKFGVVTHYAEIPKRPKVKRSGPKGRLAPRN